MVLLSSLFFCATQKLCCSIMSSPQPVEGVSAADVPQASAVDAGADASSDAATAAKIQGIIDTMLKGCSEEEQQYVATLRKALDEAGIKLAPQHLYLPVAFVRGFILDTYKDKDNKVELTIKEIKEAIAYREEISKQFGTLDSPEVEALFERHMHSYIPSDGSDFDGYPLWILDLPSPDFAEKLTKEQIVAYHSRDLMNMEVLRMKASIQHNKYVSGHVVVADMSHSKGGLGGALGVAKKLNAALSIEVEGSEKPKNQDTFYFPESMISTLILNAPWWFQGLWKVASLFLEPTTRKKIKVLGADYTSVLFERGVLGYLPRYLGGCSPNPTALNMKEFGEGVDIVGRPGADGTPDGALEYFVKSRSPELLRVCFPRTHRVEWRIVVNKRNLVLNVAGHVRRASKNESITICDGTKFEEGAEFSGTFDRTGGHGGAGGGGAKAGGQIEGEDDVRHGFVTFELRGSSVMRATTVHVTVKLVEI